MVRDRDLEVNGFVFVDIYDDDVILMVVSILDEWKFMFYCVLLGDEFCCNYFEGIIFINLF